MDICHFDTVKLRSTETGIYLVFAHNYSPVALLGSKDD